jgi:1-acyl-sn-glycerol-3-phosphate acyltransferase
MIPDPPSTSFFSRVKKSLARLVLKFGGWTVEGQRPQHASFILIAAPHTSNWDFVYMLAFATFFDLKISWMGKHGLFVPPIGWIMRALGGVAITRHENQNTVSAMAEAFADNNKLILAVPTEGTRGRAEYWKSGFYHIACAAGVPIIPSYLDYGRRRGGFGPAMIPKGNLREDMDFFREFYTPMTGKNPANFGPIRLREEGKQGDATEN